MAPRRTLIALAFLAYVSLGLPDAVPGVAWPAVRRELDQPLGALGLLLMTSMVGYFASSFGSGWLVARLGVGGVLAGSGALIVIGMLGYAAAPAWDVMVGFAVFAGLGAGAIDAALNVYAARHFSPRMMVWLHGCWGVGALLGPVIMTAAIGSASGGWRTGYTILAAIIGAITAGVVLTRRQWDAPVARADAAPEVAPVSLGAALRRPAVLLNALSFFVYTGLEMSIGAWCTSLLRESRGASEDAAGHAAALYWGSVMVGRFAMGGLTARVSPDRILRVVTLAVPLVLSTLVLTPSLAANQAALIALGVLVSPIFPLWTALTPRRVGADAAAHAIGVQVAAACLGMSLIPGALGLLAERSSLEVVPVAWLVIAALVLVLHEAIVAVEARRRPS